MTIQTDPDLQSPALRNQRRMAIQNVIGANFDVASMARESLGPQWEKLKKTEQTEFLHIFEVLFQDAYSRLVLDFLKREQIAYEEPRSSENRVEINTTILRTNEEIPVDYTLKPTNGQWLVCDVRIDGISIVEKYRRSFARVIQNESYQALLEKMRLQQQAIKKEG
jgi:phospholipid transport system substrate-binding protein